MRNEFILILALAVLLVGSNSLPAAPANEPTRSTPSTYLKAMNTLGTQRSLGVGRGDLIPLSAPAYRSQNDIGIDLPTVRAESDGLLRYHADATGSGLLQDDAGDPSKDRSYLPVLLSLFVPGTGEIYMGYYGRGITLVGVEVLAWTGYSVYHDRGLESRKAYEQFADEHWSYDKWLFDHRAVRDLSEDQRTFDRLYEIGGTTWDDWPGFHSWHSKEEEKQNYYENIGKYDWFISGWEDWQWNDVTKPDNPPRNTDLRDEYRSMRKTSNDELDKAQKFIYLSLAARVFSLVETVLLVRKDNRDEQTGDVRNLTVGARATGLRSGKVELKYRW